MGTFRPFRKCGIFQGPSGGSMTVHWVAANHYVRHLQGHG